MLKTEAQAIFETLKGCPFCRKALTPHIRGAGDKALNPYASCKTDGCYGNKMPVLSLDVPADVEAWQQREDAAQQDDKKLLDFLQDQCLDLRCISSSDGEDVCWRTVQHHMGKPHERIASQIYGDDPRKAIREAMARLQRDPHCVGPLHEEDAAPLQLAESDT